MPENKAENILNQVNSPEISREEKVAQRWLRRKGIKPVSIDTDVDNEATLEKDLFGEEDVLVSDAYDLFSEKEDLKKDLLRVQTNTLESPLQRQLNNQEQRLTVDRKRELIKSGRVDLLLAAVSDEKGIMDESVKERAIISKERIDEIDYKLDQLFAKPDVYEAFKDDMAHQLRIRHQAKEVMNLDKLLKQIEVITLRFAREAHIEGRKLNTSEKQIIEDNKSLKQDIIQRQVELKDDPEVEGKLRILELLEYKKQMEKFSFAVTPSRQEYLDWLQQAWSEGKKPLLTGQTGTGKTELAKFAARHFFGVMPEFVTGHQDMSIYELFGKNGFIVEKGDVFRPAPLIRAMNGRDGRGGPFLFDEFDRAPNQAIMGIKTTLNVKPGYKGFKVQTDSNTSIDVGQDYTFTATANVKSDKYITATELDPAIVRVMDSKEIDYMPAYELFDLSLATLMDKKGSIPLEPDDINVVLFNFCNGVEWIQQAYQGKQVMTSETDSLKARGNASIGENAALKKALLDPGKALGMLSGWQGAQAQGVEFKDFLADKIIDFINNRTFPDDDRYYLTEIFALKGFFKEKDVSDFMVSGLTQDTLNSWSGV